MKKILSLVLALAMMLSVGATALADDAYVFWYTFGDVYLTSVRTALNDALTAKGLNTVDQDANATQATQTDQINNALVSGASAIVINMCESGAIGVAENLLNTVKGYGLPCVFFNRAISQNDEEAAALIKSYPEKSVFVGTKFEEAGQMQGTMIGNFVLENYDAIDLNGDGVITYVMFKGDEANQEAIARTQYGVEFADAVLTAAGKPALKFYDDSNASKYLVDLNGTWSNTASFEYMTTILSMYNEANGNMVELIIANNDDMALGAVNALSNNGYNTGEEGAKVIPVFGVDATDAAKELIAADRMTGTIKQDAEGMADAVAHITANMVAGKPMLEGLNANYGVIDGWMVTIPYSVYTGE